MDAVSAAAEPEPDSPKAVSRETPEAISALLLSPAAPLPHPEHTAVIRSSTAVTAAANLLFVLLPAFLLFCFSVPSFSALIFLINVFRVLVLFSDKSFCRFPF